MLTRLLISNVDFFSVFPSNDYGLKLAKDLFGCWGKLWEAIREQLGKRRMRGSCKVLRGGEMGVSMMGVNSWGLLDDKF